MRYLPLAMLLAACAPEPDESGAEPGDSALSFERFTIYSGDVASIELVPWSQWHAMACDGDVCTDVTSHVIVVGGFLCGPLDFDGLDYAREMDAPDHCVVKAESFDLTITLSGE